MSFATLHRRTLLLAAVALTMLTGCAWAPGALCLDPFIHHRNYRAAKVAWMTFGHADLGPWAPLCRDFETGWRQGYYDVAGGMDGQRPITPPRRYWAARYQTPAGQQQVEAWFAGYELGAAAAQRDGIGYWAFVPTSLGVPAQERIEEHGTIGYRVMPEEGLNTPPQARSAPYAEPIPAAEPEPVRPRRLPPELPLPTAPPLRREAPRPAPESTEPTSETPPAAVETPPPAVDESPAPSEPPATESTDDPFAAPTDETPATEAERPDVPAMEEDEEEMDVFAPVAEPAAEASVEEPAPDESPPAVTPEVDAEAPPLGRPIERDPPDPGTGAPAIPRRDINWPPRPTPPRQPGQQAPAEGELPKGLDTDEPLPDVNEGAAVMRRPRAMGASSIKTLATRTGSNRLRLAPAAPVATAQAPAASVGDAAVTTVAAEEPLNWSPRIEPALHTTPSEVGAAPPTSSDSAATAAPAAGEVDEANEQAVIEGLRAFSAGPAANEEAAADEESPTAAAPNEGDLFSGLRALEESSGDE